jgi:hypothetical protein
MAISVNPPPFLKLPPEFLKDRQTRAFIEQQNQIIFQLWNRLGGSNDAVSDLENFSSNGFSSQTQWIQRQIDGLPEFTMDTTGFTMDSTEFTMDKVIAQQVTPTSSVGVKTNNAELYANVAANTLAIAANTLAISKVIPHTVSGTFTAGGQINQMRDSGVFTMPLASDYEADTILVAELPKTFTASTPTLTRNGSDLFRDDAGTDTSITWAGSARITFTTNGINEWSL